MAINLKNPISEDDFIFNQRKKYVLASIEQEQKLTESIKAITAQNHNEFRSLVDWFCKCLEQLMGDFDEWQKPTVHSHTIKYGDKSDIYYRFDIYFGGLWRSNPQMAANPASMRNPLPPFDLDSDKGLHIEDSVTSGILQALTREFLLPEQVKGDINKFGELKDGFPKCTYTPYGNMMVGFSVCYTTETLGYINAGMRELMGKNPTPLYVFSRVSPKVSSAVRDLALDRVMAIGGSMI